MSSLESYVFGSVGFVLILTFLKWKKPLLVVVLLELAVILVLSGMFLVIGGLLGNLILMFTFFVGEALVLLSSLFSILYSIGMIYSVLSFQ